MQTNWILERKAKLSTGHNRWLFLLYPGGMDSCLFVNFMWKVSSHKTGVSPERIKDYQFIKLKQIAKGNCFTIIS